MEIFKEFIFEAAHRLPNVPKDQKCARLHGHSFRVVLHVDGPMTTTTGWVMDFADIASSFQPLLERLYHNYLNEIEGLENPTSEHLAVWIWDRLSGPLNGLSEVVVFETPTAGCVYRGP
jgi:6-pyruvoyltetrahydropterin/6-carboxytetrahydropterin synthase